MLSKTPAAEVDGTDTAKEKDFQKTVPPTVFKKFLKDARACQADVDEASCKVGELTSKLTKKYSLSAPIVSLIRRLDRKEPEKLAAWKDEFDALWDASGLEARAESAQRLPIGDEAEGSDEE